MKFIFTLFLIVTLYGQEKPKQNSYYGWFSASRGYYITSTDFIGQTFDFELSYRFTGLVLTFKTGQDYYDKFLDYNSEIYNHFQFLAGYYNQYDSFNIIYSIGISMNDGRFIRKGYYFQELSEEDLFDFREDIDRKYNSLLMEFEYNYELFPFLHVGSTSTFNIHTYRFSLATSINITILNQYYK